MSRFARIFGLLLGMMAIGHGIALATRYSPLMATGNKGGALFYFMAVESLLGAAVAWALSGLLWVAIGAALAYACFVPARPTVPAAPITVAPGPRRRRRRRRRMRA